MKGFNFLCEPDFLGISNRNMGFLMCEFKVFSFTPCWLTPLRYPPPPPFPHAVKLLTNLQIDFDIELILFQIDLPLSLVFYKWILSQELSLNVSSLQFVDPVLYKSFSQLEDIVRQKRRIELDTSHVSLAPCLYVN